MRTDYDTQKQLETLPFSFWIDTIDEGTQRIVPKLQEAQLRCTATQFPLHDWAQVEELLNTSPLWAQVAIGVRSAEKLPDTQWDVTTDPIGRWGVERFAQYKNLLIDFLQCFATADTAGVLQALRYINTDATAQDLRNECELLSSRLRHTLQSFYDSHTPRIRETFTHKGQQFVVRYDAQLYGKFLTWGEATEALVAQEDYTAQDKVRDAQAFEQYSAHVVAAFARKVTGKHKTTGAFKIESRPTGIEEWQTHITQRREFFADLPMNIVLDVGFFLQVSFHKQNPTLSMGWHLKSFQTAYSAAVETAKGKASK